MSGTNPVVALVTVLILVVAALIGIYVLPTLQESADLDESVDNKRFEAEPTNVQLDADRLENVVVRNSTGNAVVMGYNESRIEASNVSGFQDYPFVLSAWGRLADNASVANDYYLSSLGNGSAVIQYRDGEWVGTVNNSTHGATVRTNSSDPYNLTQVALRTNATHVEIWVNGSRQNTTAITQNAGNVSAAVTWYGTIDEVRAFNETISDSNMSSLYSEPVGGLEGNNNTGRLMLDEGEGSDAYVIYANSSADLKGDVSWGDGLNGSELTEGTDYEINRQNGTIRATDGGALDGAPVGYITYDTNGSELTNQLQSDWATMMKIVAVLFVLMIAGVFMGLLRGM